VYRWVRRRDGSETMGTGGIAGIRAAEATRDAVLEAMRARRVWATSGPRIFVDVTLDGHAMGSRVPRAELSPAPALVFRVFGTAPIETLHLVRTGEPIELHGPEDGRRDVEGEFRIESLRAGEYVYLRAIQTDQSAAWSSPIFVE
jgi:hypothetical protein